MAEITKLSRLLNGVQRHVDLASNTLVASEIKVGGSGASGTVLSKTNLDILIGGSADASALHNHDGRYFTQNQLGSTTNGSAGASLIGMDSGATYNNIATPTDVQDAIQKLDVALTTAGATEFADNEFRVMDNGDNTKKMAFELAGVTTATTRTLTIQDKDITIAGIADETFTGTTTVNKLEIGGQAYAPIQSQSASTDSTIDWDESNVQRITLDQASTSLTFSNGRDGGQYLLIIDQDGTGGRSVTFPADVDFIGPAPSIQQGAGERTIVSFFYDPSKSGSEFQGLSSNDIVSLANGGTGANLSASPGSIVYGDADSMEFSAIGSAGQVLQSNGTAAPSWLTLSGGDGVAYSSGAFSVDLDTNSGLEFNSGAIRVQVDATGGSNLARAIDRNANGLAIKIDDSTIGENGSQQLEVKDDSITSAKVAFANNTALRIRNAADSAYVDAIKLDASDDIVFGSLPKDATVPTDDAHLTNKAYVDSQISAAAAGLDPKESVRAASTADVGGTYVAGEITGLAALAMDGVTLAQDDRVLLKDQTDALENGIYIYDLANDKLVRASDHDGTPANEVSVGNFTFVENGTVNSGRGYVLIKDGANDGILTLDTHNINWSLFSSAGAFNGGDGIDITTNVISVDLAAASGLEFSGGKLQLDLLASGGLKLSGNELAVEPADFAGEGLQDDGSDNLALHLSGLTGEAAVDAADVFGFYDDSASAHRKITWAEMLTKAAGAGLALNTDVLDIQTGDGIEISSDAVALDIDGIAGSTTSLESADLLAIHDDSAAGNATISIGNALGDGLGLSSGKIAAQLGNGLEFDTSAQSKLAFDALSAETSMAEADVFAFQDADAASADADHKKITLANLLTQIAGDGLASASGALSVSASEGVKIANDQVELDINGLSAETVIADSDELVFYDSDASAHKKITKANLIGDLSQVSETMVAGESFEANTVHAVRMAQDGETAGRVYKGDNDASASDNFYVIGLAINDTASAIAAGSDIKVVKLGALELQASDLSFVAADAGKPVYLSATGDLTLTAPSAADEAVVKVGVLRDVASNGTLEVQIQVMGIN